MTPKQEQKLDDIAVELAERLADSEAAREKMGAETLSLQEQIERLKRTAEDLMNEGAALRAEIAGSTADPRKANIGNEGKTLPAQKESRAARLTRALMEAAQKG
jgi:hypothetical protein